VRLSGGFAIPDGGECQTRTQAEAVRVRKGVKQYNQSRGMPSSDGASPPYNVGEVETTKITAPKGAT
jgi:hypothetical protein